MAIFKLGAIVTEIAGSIGGTTFKRGAGNRIIMNKTSGTSSSRLLLNNQLNPIRVIFQKWKMFDDTHRADWNLIALDYQFPDKFGVLRNLTGRQLFTKLNIQLLPVGSSILEADQVGNIIYDVTIDNFTIATDLSSAELQYVVDTDSSWVLVQLEVSLKTLMAPIFTRRKVTAFAFLDGAGGFDILAALLEQFPFINSSYNVRAFVTSMNESGFKNVSIYKDAVWVV